MDGVAGQDIAAFMAYVTAGNVSTVMTGLFCLFCGQITGGAAAQLDNKGLHCLAPGLYAVAIVQEHFVASGHIPRAIFCAYDYMAIGAIRYCWEHGLKVPEDVAIIGMDDIPENSYLNPPLSSINFNMDKICAIAAEAIIKRLTDPAFTLEEKVPATLHLRASSQL